MKNQIRDLIQINSLMKSKIENFDERLKKIESVIDEIQISVIKKIGSFGQNISDLKNEMIEMSNNFSKVLNPLADKMRKEKE